MMSDLDGLESSLCSLGLDNADEVLERCGSVYGVFAAVRDELEKENIGEAFGYLACGNAIVERAVEEKSKETVPRSPGNAAVNAAAILWRGGNECLLSLGGSFNVDRVLRFRRSGGLKKAVGFAAAAQVRSFIWVRRANDGDTAKQKRVRVKRVRRAMYLLNKIGIEALDCIECRRGRMYSAFAEKYVGGNNSDKTPYPAVGRDNKIEVIKNGRAFRHGRDSRSDEPGQLYQSVLQGAVR